MHFELTNQSLATILMDCMHHYPSFEKSNEAFGLILGAAEPTSYIGEYSFPVGNVDSRAQTAVSPNKQINQMIINARKLVATSTSIATYHSHPFDNACLEWARPSNADCHYFLHEPLKVQLIVAVAQVYDESKPYQLVYEKDITREFIPVAEAENLPEELTYSTTTQYIQGNFQNFAFEIRAYFNTGHSLKDIDLFSSEVELNQTLLQHDIHLEQLPAEAMYNIRKLEYVHRQNAQKNAADKIDYHLEKVKKHQIENPQLLTENDSQNIIFINGLLFKEATSLNYEQAIQLALKGHIFADLHEENVVLCQVLFDDQANVLFLEDLEKEVGTTIDLADYMVENGYFEDISLCNIRRFPLTFWVLEEDKK